MSKTEELERLTRATVGWSNCNRYWPLEEEEAPDGVHVVGAINEDGEHYDVMCIDADTYGTAGESAKLAAFYAAANPATVLDLIEQRHLIDLRLHEVATACATVEQERDRLAAQKTNLLAALQAYQAAGFGDSTDFVLQGKAYDLAVEAISDTEQKEQGFDFMLSTEKVDACSALEAEKQQ